MGIFDRFRKKSQADQAIVPSKTPHSEKNDTLTRTKRVLAEESARIPVTEKVYYQPDDYYQTKSYEGTSFERTIVSFEEYKDSAIPTANHLFVPEILMLHYCSKYPKPKNGYPGYWWYQYGIRDVGTVFKSLETRGFLYLDPEKGKYALTEIGKQELSENQYVPYMHSNTKYTTFTVWDLNKILGDGDKSHYMKLISDFNMKTESELKKANVDFMANLKEISPERHDILHNQNVQIKAVQEAERKYKEDKDLDWAINFWEDIWENGGLIFEGSRWMFMLPDLYIKAKRYDDAIKICNTIKKTRKSYYHDKADAYIEKIQERKRKAAEKVKQ